MAGPLVAWGWMVSTERGTARRPPGRKAQLLGAAGELFHRRGYHQVSMAEVAAEVGITAPALYRHFRGKPELLRRVVDLELSALHEAVLAGADGPAALCAALAAAAVDHRTLGTLWQRDARLLPAAQRAELRRALRADVQRMARVVGATRPELAYGEAEFLSWSVLSVYGSLSHHTFAPPRRRFERLLRQLGTDVLALPSADLPADLAAGLPADLPADGRDLRGGDPTTVQLAAGATESRREELLTAAVRLFHERGFDNVSTDQLGAAVGIAGPSVYKHFDSKSELLAAALVRSRERLWHEVEGAIRAGTTPAGALSAGLRAYVGFAGHNVHYLGAMLSETDRLAEPDRKAALDFRRDFLRTWVGLLQQLRPEYENAEARIRVHAMFALVNDGVRSRPGGAGPELTECLIALGRAVLGTADTTDAGTPRGASHSGSPLG
ncbi:helix-turn-helix domain-containing protein [Kitasatospora sp. MAP5-34]|uniref:TetR/AcrR family transcriptional regulator n=1 Tax=Kitasatospora sp. MAP5-34 TaxID=3035102 RepID=UPI00247303FD|nr:helix-turn-helix domain-containing protein [Kitasatospora sp. MAP5-34]MDH6576663.1 AcrR family transcriptional regulator [Kitasatospora sp. MAP5-34]